MSDPSLFSCLVHPCAQLVAFNDRQPRLRDLPYLCWLGFTAIAVGGSCLYGGSLSLVIKGWEIGASALLLTLSAGLAWCVFGPLLVLFTRKNAFTCAHACLVTMAYGEAILAIGALLNLIFASAHAGAWLDPVVFNICWVGLSNVVMAVALAVQLGSVRVEYGKTLLIWMLALNGSGVLFFLVFKEILPKGH